MSILQYFQRRNGLPDPKGQLSKSVRSSAVELANAEVEKAIAAKSTSGNKRGTYTRYSPSLRAEIGKYTSVNGVAASARHFTRKLGHKVSETTAHSMKKAYVEELKRKRSSEENEVTILPFKKRGRPLLLGDLLDEKVQLYLKGVRDAGGVVTARIAEAAAKGIVKSYDQSLLAEKGGHVELNRFWAYSLLKRMKFVKRKVTTAKSKYTPEEFKFVKQEFLRDVVETVEMEEIPPELILNWDQTGIKIVPSNTWTMERQGTKRVDIAGANDKRLITAVFCGSLVGEFLPVQVIYKGKTPRCHPKYEFPLDWHITHSAKHWSNEVTMIEYVQHIVLPYVERVRDSFTEETPALVIMDNFKGQITPAVMDLLDSNNIHVCLLPLNMTDRLQPMDVSVNKPAKDFLKSRFEDWYAEQVTAQLSGEDIASIELEPISLSLPVLKELGAKWLVQMAEHFHSNPQIIVNGFVKSGISHALNGVDLDADEDCSIQSDTDTEDDFDFNESIIISDDDDDDC